MLFSECGVIGSRARLRIWYREMCGFESHHSDSKHPMFGSFAFVRLCILVNNQDHYKSSEEFESPIGCNYKQLAFIGSDEINHLSFGYITTDTP